MYCVYKITDLRNSEVIYIGKTNNFNSRRRTHFTDKRPKIDKYMFEQGREHFEMSIMQDDIESNDEAVKIEDQFIVEINPIMNKQRSGNIKKNNPKDYKKDYMKEYAKSEKQKEYRREYYKSDKWKEYQQEYQREYHRQYYLKKKQEKLADASNFSELL